MSSQNIEFWLRLIRAEIPYRAKLVVCAQKFPANCIDGGDQTVSSAKLNQLQRSLHSSEVSSKIDQDLAWLNESDQRTLIDWTHHSYPEQLRQIGSPPLALFVEGNSGLLSSPQIAIVGSRRATPSGREIAQNIAEELSYAGLTITSGLATGIDAAAHHGALRASGGTIAVIATGCDQVYPKRHKELSQAVIQKGCVVSEFPIGVQPLAKNFPRRNRIISGLSQGALVVEAAVRSGSLITARLAAEQGREVFAVPGSIRSPLSRGCHKLIRDGAVLVESAQDILQEFGLQFALDRQLSLNDEVSQPVQMPIPSALGPQAIEVLAHIDFAPAAYDQLLKRSGIPGECLSIALLELELNGLVCKSAGFFSRSK
ncbi:MAG: DNA processing protein [Parasphingorhabdus sp.]|jgi:DNA processing protein